MGSLRIYSAPDLGPKGTIALPSDIFGFTGNEIVSRVLAYIGNSTNDIQTYVENSLPLAEFRFSKVHDWDFLHKTALSFAVTNGVSEYDLTVASLGFYMAASDVESVYDETNGRVLRKMTLKDIRRLDPKNDDGDPDRMATHWAPIGDNRIKIYPPEIETGTLKIDGKITPSALSTLTNFPTIPYRYQESFIEYIIALALDRENDDRAAPKKQEAIELIRSDVQDDLMSQGDIHDPRIRNINEAAVEGIGGSDLQSLYLDSLFRNHIY